MILVEKSPFLGGRVARFLEVSVARMREVLQNMMEWEGYRETVALLESTIAAQSELRTATLDALAHRLDDILGTDEPEDSRGGTRPPK